MAYTGRKCKWRGQEELRPETPEEFEDWLQLPRGCCAPDGGGHLWAFPCGYSWNNPPPNKSLETDRITLRSLARTIAPT